ncbi:hypothetical protein LZ30DRAFT_802034, partial [Colletotrichum cereale]
MYWLSGMAGAGKSTVARTMAERFADLGILGPTFFFAHEIPECNRMQPRLEGIHHDHSATSQEPPRNYRAGFDSDLQISRRLLEGSQNAVRKAYHHPAEKLRA